MSELLPDTLTSSADDAVLRCESLSRSYRQGPAALQVLRDVQIRVGAGEIVAIVGASGSGKSTLLHLLGGLDVPSSGTVSVMGRPMAALSEAERGQMRNAFLGFVYQFHHLLGEFSALENVAMPLLIRRMPEAEAMQKATAMLREVGLGERLQHVPGELSGGERQRAALARALVTEPRCVLADEPTGNLDSANGENILRLLRELTDETQTALVLVTHSEEAAAICHRRIHLRDGRVVA